MFVSYQKNYAVPLVIYEHVYEVSSLCDIGKLGFQNPCFSTDSREIKALASARGSEKKKKNQKKIRKKIVPVPIYVFVDSEQKAEFKVRIKPCSHQPKCMKFLS